MSRLVFALIALAYLVTYTLNAVVAKSFTQPGHLTAWVYLVNQTLGSVALILSLYTGITAPPSSFASDAATDAVEKAARRQPCLIG